ncbi:MULTISPECIES: DUF3054 domain-containing protein [unclassified Arthrobacter]|uniref:DUF3054 domain-containing protein n=1 Tax=unclassified Arthrobacter TaxID=235627 RepID=UPI0024E0342E|nr:MULTISPECIES: DUF3054 domain-containing protein [unclassified Arthrobacter]MCC9145466.1 DUF3054 domain-containing protein [Arthrobacter sp. zg-Y919]MDK1276694.1 DUF3054 domain-containing protein [Arthrobacter sp. zg.Y919]WIB04360.1 DUF3054 domain-containing protein [Arthrobacter sp. zg-Y919]
MTRIAAPSATPAANTVNAARWPAVLGMDLVLIIVFAALGRQSHEHGLTVPGILATALPFLIACLLSWGAMRAWRRPAQLWPAGTIIWLGTVAAGLGLRALAGGGTAVSFQVVTLVVLGAFLLGRRLAWTVISGRRHRSIH